MKASFKYVVSAILMVVFLYLAFQGTDFSRLLGILREANYSWIFFMVVFLVLSNVFRSWRWRYLIDPIKPKVGMRNLFSATMIGYMVNNIVPRAGELVRPYNLAKLETLSTSSVLGTVVAERILDMLALLFLLVSLPIVYDGPLRDSFPWLEQSGKITAAVLAVLVFSLIVLMFRRDFVNRLVGIIAQFLPRGISEKVQRLTNSFLDGFLIIKHPSNYFGVVMSSLLIWLMYVLMTYTAFRIFGLEHWLGMRAAIVVLAISSIGVALPTPGATGTYHFFTMQALVRLFSISDEVALSYATVSHAVTYASVTLIGLYFLLRDKQLISSMFSRKADEAITK